MTDIFRKDVIYVICGHYGVGKTNVAVNMALNMEKGDITLIDLDIVNPFFRSADNKKELEERGIRVITRIPRSSSSFLLSAERKNGLTISRSIRVISPFSMLSAILTATFVLPTP